MMLCSRSGQLLASPATLSRAAPCVPIAWRSGHSPCPPPQASASPAAPAEKKEKAPLRFQYEPAHTTRLSFRTWHQRRQQRAPSLTRPEVDIMVEGEPLGGRLSSASLDALCKQLKQDMEQVVPKALQAKLQTRPDYKLPRVGAVSVVLCDDPHITKLNASHRGKTAPTDVLSFELEDDLDFKMHLPMKLLGDIVVSLDTAQRQASERGYGLLDELRVLIVHGMLHLSGLDHERSNQDARAMASAEQAIMQQLGWKGHGLIDAAEREATQDEASSSDRARTGAQKKGSSRPAMSEASPTPSGRGGSLGVLGNVFGGGSNSRSGSSSSSSSSEPRDKRESGRGGSTRQASTSTKPEGGKVARSSSSSSSSPTQEDTLSRSSSSASASSSGSGGSSAKLGGSIARVKHSGLGGQQPSGRGDRLVTRSSAGGSGASAATSTATSLRREDLREPVRLVALDMDGTLLDNTSRIHPAAADAIRAACAAGVRVILATGKARPGAIKAAEEAGLAGDNLLVSPRTPGIFLQGLAVYDSQGQQISNAALPPRVVEDAFRFNEGRQGSLVAFLGDDCVTLQMTDDLQALHHVYHEPLARVAPSLEHLMAGPPVRKLLFMSTPEDVTNSLTPHWNQALQGLQATPLQAVPQMLEILPEGVDKWIGTRQLLDNLGLPPSAVMAVGDGMNDFQLVANAGVGVAVGNAVPRVKEVAKWVAASNHEGGVAQALERFVL